MIHGCQRIRSRTFKHYYVLLWIACAIVWPSIIDTARAAERPNILLAIADDWSYGHAGAYGCKWVNTPGFDRVAKEGLLFHRVYTPNAKCAPSRACLSTGRNSWQLKDACNHICFFPPEFKTYAEALSENGYQVGVTGKGWGPGVANDQQGNRRQMAGTPYNRRMTRPPARAMSNNDYSANFSDFLETVPRGQPWCFWYGTSEPHRGYDYGVGVSKSGKKLTDVDRVPGFWPDNETIRNDMLDYAFEVEYFDLHLMRILREIEERGELANTLVVVTSDHGMPFPRCKGQAYDLSNHVPLAVMWGDGIKQPGRVIADYVSFIDLAPTIIDVTRLDWSETGMKPSLGRSLQDIFRSDRQGQVTADRDHVLVGKERHDIGRPNDEGYPIRGIFKNDMLFLHNFKTSRWPACNPETGYLNCDGSPTKTVVLGTRKDQGTSHYWEFCFGKRPSNELYNVKTDPDCLVNLAEDPDYKVVKLALQDQLISELRAQGDPRMFGRGDTFDKFPYATAATRNFYERYMNGEKIAAGWVNRSDFDEKLD